MASKWRKVKLSLGLNLCIYIPRTLDESPPSSIYSAERLSDAAQLSSANCNLGPSLPTPSSHALKLSKSWSISSKVFFFLSYSNHYYDFRKLLFFYVFSVLFCLVDFEFCSVHMLGVKLNDAIRKV